MSDRTVAGDLLVEGVLMSLAMIVTVGVLMPVAAVGAAFATVAATYWWEKRTIPTPRVGTPEPPADFPRADGVFVRQ